ncbi:hypothetical protein VitviT2T_015644 [Vitis vinifera]|uniref:Protein kinase domain-containing protein n=2 Tax=Vitis vinifera TaxID=29760 RepID=A0ABY9CNC6_VITVI|nr:hypothetical protein VitviT2T_015644 [Vitis vinifera]
MISYLEKLQSRVAITTDMWTSNQKKGYMAITVHYIDESWLLHHHIVRFVYVPPPHTKEVLSDVLMDFLLDWNMDRKVSTVTVDNCSSNDGMINILVEKLSLSDSLLLNGKIFHMRCAAHVLNLIVKEGLDVIEVEIEKIRESVAYWSATPSRMEKFEDAARQLRIPCNKKLSLDCKTRWNSTYLMLSIAITYKDVFPRLKQREKYYMVVPSEEEWNMAKEICGRLKLFYNITKLFSGRNYPTANTFFIKVCEIKEALYDWLICSNDVVKTMASSMLQKFDKYWSGCHIVMAIAAIFDPRYKIKILEFYFPLMYGSEASNEIEKIRGMCYELLSEYQSKSNLGQKTSSYGTSSGSTLLELNYDEQDPLSKFDLFVHSTTGESHTKSELDYYLEESILPRNSNFDVLSWWKTNGIKYPTLQMIVRDIYAIPVSIVASESAFSTGGRVVSKHRSRLHPDTLEALMCAQSWLWKEKEERNLLKGITTDENTAAHDFATLGVVNVRYCGYIVVVKLEGKESSKMDTHFQSIELLDQPEGGANALNINRWELGACWIQHLQDQNNIEKDKKPSTANTKNEMKVEGLGTPLRSLKNNKKNSDGNNLKMQSEKSKTPAESVIGEAENSTLSSTKPQLEANANENELALKRMLSDAAFARLKQSKTGLHRKKYYSEVALPKLVADFGSLELSPVDGRTLTDFMHTRGLRMRSLGHVVSHMRLVPLLGHCLEHDSEKLLVYKYMPNGDLSNSLYRVTNLEDDNLQSLDWITRLKIAIEAVEGLSYLHHECSPPLVHRDVQASSILLDDKFEVRLGSLSEVCAQEGDSHQNVITKLLRKPQ